jgi:DNA uptake protein ComE-like DNA-binding protein
MSDKTNELQSARLEKELSSLRRIFKEAEANEEVAQMVQLSRVILQHEKEIAKQKLAEGQTLDRTALIEYQSKLVEVVSATCKKFIPDDAYCEFIDELVLNLAVLDAE